MSSSWLIVALLVCFTQISLVLSREFCYSRSFGKDSIVCVCNVTHCDDLDPLQQRPQGLITIYETNRGGARFQESMLSWTDNQTENTPTKQIITIDRKKIVQKIIGFGGSFTDATGYMVSQLPQSLQDHFISDYFGDSGIGFNLNRLPIGGADFSRRAYSYDDGQSNDFDLKNFTLQNEDNTYKIPFMLKAKAVSKVPQNFLASPWSAPAWMKSNSEINHGGWLKGNPGEQYYKTFAKYFVKFLDAYKARNLTMWGITIENEPSAGKNPKYEFNSMGFTAPMERDFIRLDLGPTLQAAGYTPDKLNVLIFDDQRDAIHEWAQTIYNDPDAAKYVAGTAFHWYVNRADNLANLEKAYQANTKKFIVNTESSIGGVPSLGNWGNAESFARDIITDLNHRVSGYICWNMALDQAGGPNWANLTADSPVIVNPAQQEYYKQPDFYALGHFAKFILPGSVRLEHTESLQSDTLLSTVALRPDGAVVVVVLNAGESSVDYTLKEGTQTFNYFIRGRTIQSYIYW